jgi:fatty acid desaturase
MSRGDRSGGRYDAAVSAPPATPPAAGHRRRASDLVGAATLRPLLVRTDGPGAVLLCVHVGLLVLTTVLVELARGSWWVVPAWLVDGVVIAHLFALQHETAHGTAFTARRVNRVLTTVAGAVLGIAPHWFRVEHIAHHTSTQDPARDPQLIEVPRSVAAWLWFLGSVPFWAYQARTLVPHALGRFSPGEQVYVPSGVRPALRREARLMLAGWLAALVVPLCLGCDAVVVLWIVPRLLGEPVMRVARLSEHAGRPQVADVTVNTRTLDVPLPLRLLAWNMPLHAEHHAMPAVPFHALPRLRTELGPHLDPRRGGYLAAQREILRLVRAVP